MRDTMGHPVRSKEDIEREKRYRAEEDLRHLHNAAEVHSDPERLKSAMALHEEHNKGLELITGKKEESKEEKKKKETERRHH